MNITTRIVLGGLLSIMGTQSYGALLNLSQTPLFTATYVAPNIFFELDDSGSMDWEVTVKPYWNFCSYDPNATGNYSFSQCGGIVANDGLIRSYGNGDYRYFTYIFNTSDNLYRDDCNNSDYNSIQSCSSAGDKEWRVYSSDLNSIYYNPSTNYTPWVGACTNAGASCANASFSAARSNPRESTTGYTQTRDLSGTYYEVWIDDRGYDPADGRPLRAFSLNATSTPNGEIDLWDSHVKIQFNSSNVKVYRSTYIPTVFNIGETETLQATLSGSSCYNVLGSADLVRQVASGVLAYTSTGAAGCRTIADAKTNMANWYQYGRRRSFAAKNAIGNIVSRFPNYRYGINVINNTDNFFIEVPASTVTDYTSFNANLLTSLYKFDWDALGTPLRAGLARAGEYYKNALTGKANPIVYPCQQNYTILFTDGYWNDNNNVIPQIGDNDYDGIAKTLADVARYYYLTDLSPLANQVIPNAYDPATYQHMVTFTVGFGVAGLLQDTDGDGWPNPPLATNGNWGNPYNSDAEKVDDLWHAAFDSKGAYLSAQDASSITDSLTKVLSNIADRSASAAPVAQNSTVLNSSSQVYQAIFNTNSWTGDLLAFPIGVDNQLATTAAWSAACVLTGGNCAQTSTTYPGILATNRVIITRNYSGANNGIAFRWPSNYTTYKVSGSLPTNLAEILGNAPYSPNTTVTAEVSANQAYGQQLVNYLRGDRSQEAIKKATYSFRDRNSILGDIVNSSPMYVGPPARIFPDNLESSPYSTFKTTYSNRAPIIYVGANDGMLHGFSAIDGAEKIAYVPGARQVYDKLPSLSVSPYSHVYFSDGSPIESDVFYSGAWHTMLASGLGNGGQSLFALDITNPTQFTESNAANLYLFEFSDLNDPDFGYIQGQPIIAKVRTSATTSKWAIIVNNGYNSTQADGSASTTGKACLFILFIEQGINGTWVADNNYIKIPVGSSSLSNPNGLSTPYAVDIDQDYIVDYVYAGDIKGNMWKFDLRDKTPTNWKNKTSLLFAASNTTAGDQPITAPPVVGPHPNGLSYGVMVYFGTGKYLELTDNTTSGQVTQSFYGIWDKMAGATVSKTALVQQSITDEATVNNNTFRAVSSNTVNWTNKLGWYMDFVVNGSNNGERQISQPILRNLNVIYTTMTPSASVCDFGGNSWIMEVDAATGGAPQMSPFDTNNDGIFTADDSLTITVNGNSVTRKVGGMKSSAGITGTPAVMLSADKSKEVKVTSGSQGLSAIIENPGSNPGRQNWRQLY
ncbi:MAG: pilus assembly protein [Candidatus Berkiella sp.]